MSNLALRLIQENIEKYKKGEDARILDLGRCGLKYIPENLGDCLWVEELILSNDRWDYDKLKLIKSQNEGERNRIVRLSRSFIQLTNLRKLWINGDIDVDQLDICDLSPISYLNKLELLECSWTKVYDLTPLTKLTNLKILSFDLTDVEDIRPVSNLRNLEVISCANTPIVDLRPVENLTRLQQIICHNTAIKNLPPLGNLDHLLKLDCRFTQISDLSPLLPLIKKGLSAKFDTLDSMGINFLGCPLTTPPPEIVQQGNQAILNYFREREAGDAIPLREAKLLILGEGGAGKTTLARKLIQGYQAKLPLETDSTHGIEIKILPFQDKSGDTYTAHLWDFGGQEIYHATHQFFLTKRSVYILVTDARKEDTDFNYWLQIVELLSDNSPVIIVQNRKGGRMRDINLSGLQGRFRNIRGLYSIDLKLETDEDRYEMNRLKEALEMEIRRLPHFNEVIPASWARIRSELELLKIQKPFISDREYIEISEKQGLDEESAQVMGQFLHDLGIFLYFQDDPVLKRWIFLNNEWATRGVYNILDAPLVRNQKGRFTRPDAEQIWKQKDYRSMLDEMLQLMMRFELCYRIPDLQPDTFIAPQLLGATEPATSIDWDNTNNLQLRYQYEFMPKGLLNRFMVRMNRYIRNVNTEAWKTGIILHRENASAKVVETYGVRHLHVRATGKRCKEIVTVIAEEIDSLNAGYHNLRVQKLVPCNCEVCHKRTSIGKEEPNFYEYDDLIRRKDLGKATVECKISYQDVNVLRLIDDVFITTFFTPKAKKIFISYSKADKPYLNELRRHLKPLERQGLLQAWDDSQMIPGEEWDQSIRRELHSADLILLLVSSDMMATDYIWDVEMEEAIGRHERGEATVIPIIVRPSLWQDAPFARFAALPAKGLPISKWENKDDAWQQVIEKIKSVVQIKN